MELRMNEVEEEDGADEKQKLCNDEWKFVAAVIDCFCFYVFALFFFVATIVIFRHQILPSAG